MICLVNVTLESKWGLAPQTIVELLNIEQQ
jgi:hypothetical protein